MLRAAPTARYSADELTAAFAPAFRLTHAEREEHCTPTGVGLPLLLAKSRHTTLATLGVYTRPAHLRRCGESNGSPRPAPPARRLTAYLRPEATSVPQLPRSRVFWGASRGWGVVTVPVGRAVVGAGWLRRVVLAGWSGGLRRGVSGERADFFVSHASRDQIWAEWLGWELLQAGYTVELAVWDWTPGQDFVARMEAALSRAERLLAVWTPGYFQAPFAGVEFRAAFVRHARDEGRVVPVLVEPATVPVLYASLIYLERYSELHCQDR